MTIKIALQATVAEAAADDEDIDAELQALTEVGLSSFSHYVAASP